MHTSAVQPAAGASSTTIHSQSASAFFYLTVLAFLGVTLWLAAVLNLYVDEAYSLHTTERGIAYAIDQSLVFEQQPPLYFVALAMWRMIDHGIFFARLTSIACCTATLFIVRDFAKRQLRNLPVWLPSLFIATNPFTIWAAVELRVYALIILLSATLIWLFFRTFVDERQTRTNYVTFTLAAIAAMYTQYFFVATLAAFGLVLLVFDRRRLGGYLTCMVATIVAIIPLLGIVRAQASDASLETLAHPTSLAIQMLSTMASFALPHGWISAIGFHAVAYLYDVLFLFMATVAFLGIGRNRTVVSLALVVGSIAVFFGIVILVLHDPIEMPRHITTLFVPTVLMALVAVSSSFRVPRRRLVLALYLAIYLTCASAEVAHAYRPLAKIGDWHRVADYLAANAKASEPIAVFDAENALPLSYYYRGPSTIVPIPHEQTFTHFARRDFAIANVAELERSFPASSAPTNSIWLVSMSPCRYPQLGESCETLASYVSEHFQIVQRRQFDNTGVYELRSLSSDRGERGKASSQRGVELPIREASFGR